MKILNLEHLEAQFGLMIRGKKNLESIWGPSEKQIPIWSDDNSDNLEKIWGKKHD